jgi:hypothetical protein
MKFVHGARRSLATIFFGFITSCYASHAAVGKHGASLHVRVDVVSLFRRDDAKSVCLLRGAPLGDFEDLNEHFIIEIDGLDLAGNDTGMIARGLIGEDSTVVSVDCRTNFVPKCHLLAQTKPATLARKFLPSIQRKVCLWTQC